MKTEIIIPSTSGTTSGVIDLYDDLPISLNYNIADIRTPDKRNADYSKTITVPGTNNNNQLLSHIFEIGTDRLFNPNKKTNAEIVVDHVSVMKGILRLRDINTLRDNKIEYNLEFKGRIDDLFTAIKGLELTDITWTDLNHVWNKTNIINSWTATVGTGYVYPFIDHGYSVTLPPNTRDVYTFRIATYAKEIWDRIFALAGFQYSSSFLTGNFFKRLIIPFCSDKFVRTEAQVASNIFRAHRSGSNQPFTYTAFSVPPATIIPVTDTIIFNDDSTAPSSDAGNHYNTATGKFTCTDSGLYTFTGQVSIHVEHNSTMPIVYDAYVYGMRNTTFIQYASNVISVLVAPTPAVNEATITVNFTTFLNAGETIHFRLQTYVYRSPLFPTATFPTVQNNYIKFGAPGSFIFNSLDPNYAEGSTIDFASAIPQNIKLEDFILGIMKLFNLYFEYDKDVPNKIHIEPRDDFYNSTIQDWSSKLDESQNVLIEPMGALDAKRYIFKYKQDSDWINDKYQSSFDEIENESYGLKIKSVDNDFLKNDNILESFFSPTPQYSDLSNDRVYPRIIKVDTTTGVPGPVNSNIRILYYSGLKNCQTWLFTTVATANPTSQTQYPYCGHIDDATSGTIDLSWGVPKIVYYIPTWNATYPDSNLYNVYWRKFIEEITDKNSSIVTGWFHLTPADIAILDFRHIYQFRHGGMLQNYRLNKIYDYNPVKEGLTKCEFIKTKEAVPFVPRNLLQLGGTLSTLQGPLYHDTNVSTSPFKPSHSEGGLVVAGNNVGTNVTSGIIVLGTGNIVYDGAKNITIIQSSGNTVIHDNITIIQSSGVTTTGPNQLWIYNQLVTSGDIYNLTHCCVEHTVAEMQALAAFDLLNCCLTYKILDPEGTTDPLVIMASSGSVLNDYGEQIRNGIGYSVGYDLALDKITAIFDEAENNRIYNPSTAANRGGNCLTSFPLGNDNFANNTGTGFDMTLINSGSITIYNSDFGRYGVFTFDATNNPVNISGLTLDGSPNPTFSVEGSNMTNVTAGNGFGVTITSGSTMTGVLCGTNVSVTLAVSSLGSSFIGSDCSITATSGGIGPCRIEGGLTFTFPVGTWTGSISKVDGTSSFETTIDVDGFAGTFDFIIGGDDFSFCGVIRFTTSGAGATINALKDANLSNQIPVAFKRFYGTADTVTFVHNAVDIFNLGAVNVVLNSSADWVDYMILPNAGSPIAYEIMHANY